MRRLLGNAKLLVTVTAVLVAGCQDTDYRCDEGSMRTSDDVCEAITELADNMDTDASTPVVESEPTVDASVVESEPAVDASSATIDAFMPECTTSDDCEEPDAFCSDKQTCVDCMTDVHCQAQGLFECLEDGTCRGCEVDSECMEAGFNTCSPEGACLHECAESLDCDAPEAAYCNEENICAQCEDDAPCQEKGFDSCSAEGTCILTLSKLTVSGGNLSPGFDPSITSYRVILPMWVSSVTVTPRADADILVMGSVVQSGVSSTGLHVPTNSPTEVEIQVSRDRRTTVYTITFVREVVTQYLKPNSQTDSELGSAIVMDGDRFVVGAPDHTVGGKPTGAVYIYVKSENGWQQEQWLTTPGIPVGVEFGRSVALSGSILAIGAPKDQEGETGSVYIYRLNDGEWSYSRILRPSDPAPHRGFGSAVALGGDRLVVGSATDKQGNSYPVEVFTEQGDLTWRQEAKLSEPRPGPASVTGSFDLSTGTNILGASFGSTFGSSLAIEGNLLAVGAPTHHSANKNLTGDITHGCNGLFSRGTNCAASSGAVFLFRRNQARWELETAIKSPWTHAFGKFGQVATSNGRLFVGEPGARCRGETTGAFHTYEYGSGRWSRTSSICGPTANWTEFGSTISAAEDVVVVGAPREANSAPGFDSELDDNCADEGDCASNSGAVFIYRQRDRDFELATHAKATPAHANSRFGSALAFDGAELLVGAQGDDAVWSFRSPAPTQEATNP